VAPVGHFADGDLTIHAVLSDLWVVLGAASSLRGGYTSRILTESLAAAGVEYVELEIDRVEGNLRRYAPGRGVVPERRKELQRLDPDDAVLTRYAGGLFRPQLLQRLRCRP
jgi:hypothetical protein